MLLSPLRRSGHLPSLIAAFVYFDISFMVWMLLGALGAYVAADLNLSPGQKGLMVAVPPLGGAAFRLLLGAVADRVGFRRVGLTALGLTLVPLLWAALAGKTLMQVLFIGLLLGVAGASFAVALPLASGWYPPEHQGLALGVVGAGNSGTLVAALAGPRLAEHVGWHGVFGLAIVPVLIALGVFAVAAKEPPRRGAPSRPLAIARQPDARRLAALYSVTFGGFVGLAAYLPIFFVDGFGLAKVAAATVAALCAGTGSIVRPIGGVLADRLGGYAVLSVALVLAAAVAIGLAATPTLSATIALVVILVGLLGLGNGAVFALVPVRFPADIGSVTGLVGAAGGLGGFALPFLFGTLRQASGSFAPGFVVFAVAAACAHLGVRPYRTVGRAVAQMDVAA